MLTRGAASLDSELLGINLIESEYFGEKDPRAAIFNNATVKSVDEL